MQNGNNVGNFQIKGIRIRGYDRNRADFGALTEDAEMAIVDGSAPSDNALRGNGCGPLNRDQRAGSSGRP